MTIDLNKPDLYEHGHVIGVQCTRTHIGTDARYFRIVRNFIGLYECCVCGCKYSEHEVARAQDGRVDLVALATDFDGLQALVRRVTTVAKLKHVVRAIKNARQNTLITSKNYDFLRGYLDAQCEGTKIYWDCTDLQ